MNFTGKASIDKPWLNFYPEGLRNLDVPKITIESFLKMKNPDENKIAFEYYGNKITWKQLWEEVDIAARAELILYLQWIIYQRKMKSYSVKQLR